jgi:DNA invertase Pin-like site-specific DNA recombinase
MAGQRVGYRRVSTLDQRTDRQLDGLELDEVFEDKASGKDLKRPQWEAAEKYLRRGDVLFVHSMDRLARNLGDLLATVEGLNKKGVEVRFVRENLCFEAGVAAKPMARLMLSLLGAVAEFERSLILERQREGIALAKQRGVYKGRKRVLNSDQVAGLRSRLAEGAKVTQVARELGVCRQTLYAYLKG